MDTEPVARGTGDIRMTIRAVLVSIALLFSAVASQSAVDNAICSTADQVGCTTTNLKNNANEELPALSARAPLLFTSVSGTNAVTACSTPAITSYVDGQSGHIKFPAGNTGAMTVNFCGVGVVALTNVSGGALANGDVQSSPLYFIRYFAASGHWRILNSTVTQPTFVTKISGASGNAGTFVTGQSLSADAAGVSTTALATVMSTTNVAVGTYQFKYMVRYQSAATTTGIAIAANFTGTVTTFESHWYHVTTGTTVATGVGDGEAATVVGQYVEGKSARAVNTITSASAGVDTANSDMLAVFEGILIAGSSGTLELRVASEVAASAITVKAGTSLVLTKVD